MSDAPREPDAEDPHSEVPSEPPRPEDLFGRHSRPDSDWASADSPGVSARQPDIQPYKPQSQAAIKAIEEGLQDPDCTQIDSYGPFKFSAQFRGQQTLLDGISFGSVDDYMRWLKETVDEAQAVISWQDIEREAGGVLNTKDGSRLTIFLPPTAPGGAATFSLRKHVASEWKATDFIANDTMSVTMMDFLKAAVSARINILFVGPMGSGKTTLLRALSEGFGDNEKVGVIEQVPELAIRKPLTVPYTYLPGVEGLDLNAVLDRSLYNGLQRLIVGEVHLEGLTKMLESMILTAGSMSTYHAQSTAMAGERMTVGMQLENANVTRQTAISFIKQAIELVVVTELVHGERRVTQITEMDWRSSGGDDVLGGRDLFVYDREARKFRNEGVPPDQGGRIAEKAAQWGVTIKPDWFIDHERLRRLQDDSSS